MGFIGQTISSYGSADLVIPSVPVHASVIVGDWVRMSGGIAIKAIADNLDNSNVLGLVESLNGSTANIRVLGVSQPIFIGLDETKEYFLSNTVSGEMGLSAPSSSGSVVLKVGQPYSSTQFLVLKGVRILRS